MAQHNLALAHIAGDGIEQDYDAARRWLERAGGCPMKCVSNLMCGFGSVGRS